MANALADSSQRDLEYAYERASSPDVSSLLRNYGEGGRALFFSSFLIPQFFAFWGGRVCHGCSGKLLEPPL